MRILTLTLMLISAKAAIAQSTVSVQEPISVLPPLVLNGVQISCPGCGGSGGGGGTGSGLMPWNPPASPPPTRANWTLINGTTTATAADVTGGVLLYGNGPSGFQGYGIDGLTIPLPSGAFTATAHLSAFCMQGSSAAGGPRYGLLIGDTGTRLVDWELGDIAPGPLGRFTISNWTNPTSPVGVAWTGPQLTLPTDLWWRIQYDGTSFTFQISPTGADSPSWTTLTSIAANSFLASAPATIGLAIYPQWAGAGCNVTLGFWKVSQP